MARNPVNLRKNLKKINVTRVQEMSIKFHKKVYNRSVSLL